MTAATTNLAPPNMEWNRDVTGRVAMMRSKMPMSSTALKAPSHG
jgi:hypothetical protein